MFKNLTTVVVTFVLQVSLLAGANLPDKHPLDETKYERFVLENGLRVLLVSDPKLDMAAASMAVGVGSLMDPEDRPGLAHFLEHMLFLGTEKYPDASSYGNYLQSNGGYSNAYTSGDHTNYHFEVYPHAFEGALDRFAQFFIAPLFSEEFTEREMNAVNSEHQKNLENDSWRTYQLWRNHYNPAHPANHFSTGNLETLKGIEREEFIQFYKTYYSANQMGLVLVAPNSIAEMKAWVLDYFAPVENQGLDRVRYQPGYLEKKDKIRLIELVPIKDLRELVMEFEMPTYIESFDNKSYALINYILGFEGEGSLLSYLKSKGWAAALGANFGLSTLDYGTMHISIGLTPLGLEHYQDVVESVFAYVDLMKTSPYPSTLFEERKTMSRLEELYGNKGEGSGRAVGLANNVLFYPLELAERVGYIWSEPNEEDYFNLLNSINPQQMLITLKAKGLEVDQTEEIYGTPYRYTEVAGDAFERLKVAKPAEEMTMPATNPFVPQEVKLLTERPVKVLDEPGLVLYYSQDQEFLRPKVAVQFKIRHPKSFVNLENTVLKGIYADVVRESLNELAYPARMAGLGYSVDAGTEGLYLTLSGYNESAMTLLDQVLKAMVEIDLSEDRFEAIKDMTLRGLENFPKGDAWRIVREAKQELFHEVYFTPEQRLDVVREVTLADVKKFSKKLFKKGYVEALIHGNVSQLEATQAARSIPDALDMKALKADDYFENGGLVLNAGEIAKRALQLEVSNSAYWSEYVIGQYTPKIRAASILLNNFVAEPYYSELRTKQQLGYIVSAFTGRDDLQYALYFVVQSGQYGATEIQQRSEAFIATLPTLLGALDETAFAQLKAAAIAEVEKKAKSINEKAGGFFEIVYNLEGDFNRRNATIAALNEIELEDVVAILKETLDPANASRRLVLGYGRDHDGFEEKDDEAIIDVTAWKSAQSFE